MVTMSESCCQSQILRHTLMTGKFVLDVNHRMAQMGTAVEDYKHLYGILKMTPGNIQLKSACRMHHCFVIHRLPQKSKKLHLPW